MFLQPLNKIDGSLIAGGTVVVDCPCANTYDKIILETSGDNGAGVLFTIADIDSVSVLANNRRIWECDAVHLDAIRRYQNIFREDTRLTLDFTEPNARGNASAQLFATIPANQLQRLTVEVKLKSDATIPAGSRLKALAQLRQSSNNPYIRKRIQFNFSWASTGRQELFLPKGESGGIIPRIFLFTSGDVFSELEVRNGPVSVYQATKSQIEYLQKENKLVPQSNLIVPDFAVDGNIADSLVTNSDKVQPALFLQATAAGSLKGYIEYIDPINRL